MTEQGPIGQEAGKQPKVVRMPEREVIMRKLQDIETLGVSEQTNAFFSRLAEFLGDGEIVGMGLNVVWELAQYDTMRQYPPIVRAAVDMSFDRVIDAITPDLEVAEDAKVFRRKIVKEAEKERKASEPRSEDLGVEDSLQDFERFSQAIQVGDMMREYTEGRSRKRREGSLQDDNNPYYRQTHRGFFLEDYYGSPHWLHTPWGEYRLSGDGERFTGDQEEFLRRLGATMHKPRIYNDQGTFGPIYAVHKIDDVELPDPVERPRSAYKPYEEAGQAWNQLARQYYEVQGQTPPLTVLEKFALDDAILEARGRTEPPITEFDHFRVLDYLKAYKGKVIKYTMDQGKTWHYTKLADGELTRFSDGSIGYMADEEVLPNIQGHASIALTDKGFFNGMVFRPTTEEEIKGMKFSYDFSEEED